jgi:hypothetical protein
VSAYRVAAHVELIVDLAGPDLLSILNDRLGSGQQRVSSRSVLLRGGQGAFSLEPSDVRERNDDSPTGERDVR